MAGEIAAKLYLKYLRARETDCALHLQHIVFAATERLTAVRDSRRTKAQQLAFDTLTGQLVGFLSTLDSILGSATKGMPGVMFGLDAISDERLRSELDAAVNSKDKEVLAACRRDRRAKAARKGWRARRRPKSRNSRKRGVANG